MRLDPPRYALVVWADNDSGLPCCITLDSVQAAVERGAVVVAREDDICREPLPKGMDMNLLSNPRRRPEPPPSNGDEA